MRTDGRKIFSIAAPVELIGRIRLESVRRGLPIQELVTEALDNAVPRSRIVLADEPSTRRATKGAGLKS